MPALSAMYTEAAHETHIAAERASVLRCGASVAAGIGPMWLKKLVHPTQKSILAEAACDTHIVALRACH